MNYAIFFLNQSLQFIDLFTIIDFLNYNIWRTCLRILGLFTVRFPIFHLHCNYISNYVMLFLILSVYTKKITHYKCLADSWIQCVASQGLPLILLVSRYKFIPLLLIHYSLFSDRQVQTVQPIFVIFCL